MSTSIPYNLSLCCPYTGTLEQPDTVSVFFKSGNEIKIHDENCINSLHYSPMNYFENLPATAWRIGKATQTIFQGNSQEFGNALKNLSRAMVELIPVLGGGALYLYDKAKSHFFIHPQIKLDLYGSRGSVLGLAFDGKIICTFSHDTFERHLASFSSSEGSGPMNDPQGVLAYIWHSLLAKNLQQNSTKTRHDLALALANRIEQHV